MIKKIIDINIAGPISDQIIEEKYDSVEAFIFKDSLPLGKLEFEIPQPGILSKEIIKNEIQNKLSEKIWKEVLTGQIFKFQNEKYEPFISVIICTRDRAELLERCLKSLSEADYMNFEIIVVDNCTKDNSTFEVANKFNCKYVRENTPGLNYARNTGIRSASYEIVSFIDDDAIASKNWLKAIAYTFQSEKISAVTGAVFPAEIETEAQFNFESYGGMNKGFEPFTVELKNMQISQLFWASGWGVGANMSFRKNVFDKAGFFNPLLDVGTPTQGGGDIEMFYRLVFNGYALRYEPAAYIKHFHRSDNIALEKQIYNNGRSFPAYLATVFSYSKNVRFALIKFAILHWLTVWLLLRGVKSIIKKDKQTLAFVKNEIKGAIFSPYYFVKSILNARQLKINKLDL